MQYLKSQSTVFEFWNPNLNIFIASSRPFCSDASPLHDVSFFSASLCTRGLPRIQALTTITSEKIVWKPCLLKCWVDRLTNIQHSKASWQHMRLWCIVNGRLFCVAGINSCDTFQTKVTYCILLVKCCYLGYYYFLTAKTHSNNLRVELCLFEANM